MDSFRCCTLLLLGALLMQSCRTPTPVAATPETADDPKIRPRITPPKQADRYTRFNMDWRPYVKLEDRPPPMPRIIGDGGLTDQLKQLYKDYEDFENAFPEARAKSLRRIVPSAKPGEWSHVQMYPSAGRVVDMEFNPKNPKEMYAQPDGCGIYVTKDGGRNWNCITDTIPSRLHRITAYNIIVDPTDFRHVFSVSLFGKMFETLDQGATWKPRNLDNCTPHFKRVEAFHDAENRLVILGTVSSDRSYNTGYPKGVYRSEDAGAHWQLIDGVEDKLTHEMAFHKTKPNIIYIAGVSKLFRSEDYGKTFTLLKDFGFAEKSPMFVATPYGEHADEIYVALTKNEDTQLHFSADGGKSWELRQDSEKGIGHKKGLFGDQGSSTWVTYLEVDPFDSKHLISGHVNNAESFDGGVTWKTLPWHHHPKAVLDNGNIQLSPHGEHNADNHRAKFHPTEKGLVLKACDAGLMKKGPGSELEWININGNMPAFLFYSIAINEFGDRILTGNTQDVDVQTYRYGRWEENAGYEGSTIFLNPYVNIGYYSAASLADNEGRGLLPFDSWDSPVYCANHLNPDQLFVCSPNEIKVDGKEVKVPRRLYVTNDRGASYDRVPNIDEEVRIVNVSNTTPQILTALTKKAVKQSANGGGTWQSQPYMEGLRDFACISGAVDPADPKRIYVGGRGGKVIHTGDGGKTWMDISGNLPKADVAKLLFHEGSIGVVYALVKDYGVFYKNGENPWKLWMKGFNGLDFKDIGIDYPCQRLIGASYGLGVWEAPLEQAVERFYKPGFALKQLPGVDELRVFGIDSSLATPDYYNYQWFCNDKPVGANLPILATADAPPGARISLVISPRACSKVKTCSASLTVKPLPVSAAAKEWSIDLKDQHLDLGILDLFPAGCSRTVDLDVTVQAAGAIAGSRRVFFRDAKGWLLTVEKDGTLVLRLNYRHNGYFWRTFGKEKEQGITLKGAPGNFKFDRRQKISWTVSPERCLLFIDGKEVARQDLPKEMSTASLNSVMATRIFADALGYHACRGSVHSFKIWNGASNPGGRSNKITSCLYSADFQGPSPHDEISQAKIQAKPSPSANARSSE